MTHHSTIFFKKLVIGAAMLLVLVPRAAMSEDTVTLLIPAFEGPGGLGLNVATVLNLQIANTLREQAITPNGQQKSFGEGVIQWFPTPMEESSPDYVESIARHPNILAQFILWGSVTEYGGGAIAQSYLSVPEYTGRFGDFRQFRPEIWSISLKRKGSSAVVEAQIPSQFYIFEPIVMRKAIIEKFAKLSSIEIYSERRSGRRVGFVGPLVQFLEQGIGVAKVRSGQSVGWVRFEELGRYRSEVVDFVAGIIRIFRGDWDGAQDYLLRVLRYDATPTELRIDANLYLGLAEVNQGRPGTKYFDTALELNPYSSRAYRYWIMDALWNLGNSVASAAPDSEISGLAAEVRRRMNVAAPYFLRNNVWRKQVNDALEKLGFAR